MKEERRPIIFGPAGETLYGCLHLPGGPRADFGVVLCYPYGQEYLRAHRSFVQLATRLAGRGFPVLRFDYFGCGDSQGETEDGTVERWTGDIASAAAWLRAESGLTRIGLVGLRLGGTLAALTASGDLDVDALVLWDPIVDGRSYINELRLLQEQMLRYSYVDSKLRLPAAAEREEVLGFPLTARQREGIEAIDLLRLRRTPAERVLLVETDPNPRLAQLSQHLTSLSGNVQPLRMAERRMWLAEPLQGIVPFKLIEQVSAWFEAAAA